MIKVKNGEKHLWDFKSVLQRFDFFSTFSIDQIIIFYINNIFKEVLKK